MFCITLCLYNILLYFNRSLLGKACAFEERQKECFTWLKCLKLNIHQAI